MDKEKFFGSVLVKHKGIFSQNDKDFVDWLYKLDFEIIHAKKDVHVDEAKNKSAFMKEYEKHDAGGMLAFCLDEEERNWFRGIADKLDFLAKLIDKHKEDKSEVNL